MHGVHHYDLSVILYISRVYVYSLHITKIIMLKIQHRSKYDIPLKKSNKVTIKAMQHGKYIPSPTPLELIIQCQWQNHLTE